MKCKIKGGITKTFLPLFRDDIYEQVKNWNTSMSENEHLFYLAVKRCKNSVYKYEMSIYMYGYIVQTYIGRCCNNVMFVFRDLRSAT